MLPGYGMVKCNWASVNFWLIQLAIWSSARWTSFCCTHSTTVTSQKTWIFITVNLLFMIHLYLWLPSQFTVGGFFFFNLQHGRNCAWFQCMLSVSWQHLLLGQVIADYVTHCRPQKWLLWRCWQCIATILCCVLSNSLYAFLKVLKELLVMLRARVNQHV
jgi:hypothetical protein